MYVPFLVLVPPIAAARCPRTRRCPDALSGRAPAVREQSAVAMLLRAHAYAHC